MDKETIICMFAIGICVLLVYIVTDTLNTKVVYEDKICVDSSNDFYMEYNSCRIDFLTCKGYHFLNYSKTFYIENNSRCLLFENNDTLCITPGDKSWNNTLLK